MSSLALYLVLKLRRCTRRALSSKLLFLIAPFLIVYLITRASCISLVDLVRQDKSVDLVETFGPFCERHLDEVFVKEHRFVFYESNLFVQLCPLSLECKRVIWFAKRVTFANSAKFRLHFWVLEVGRALVFWQVEVVVTRCALSKLKHFDLASSCWSRWWNGCWSVVAALSRTAFIRIWCGKQRARLVSVLLSIWWDQQFKLDLLPTKSTPWRQNVLRGAAVKDMVVWISLVQNEGSLHHSLLLYQLL